VQATIHVLGLMVHSDAGSCESKKSVGIENRQMIATTAIEPALPDQLFERVLEKLGLTERPGLDLVGLNTLCAAFSGHVSNDNIQKRIWFAGEQASPVTGGDPIEFFENWLAHGTGGTCFPINNAIYTLARSIGFDARRIAGSMIVEGLEQDANHGSVLVTLEGVDYLVDAQLAAFKALPLVPDQAASTGEGIHDIKAVPVEDTFHVLWYAGHNREQPITFHATQEYDPVDHVFFLTQYDLSRSNSRSPFNESLYICRHFSDSILTLGRSNKITVASDNTVTTTELTDEERRSVLVEEFGISEETVNALPPDVPGGSAF
jgi:arylamine N-acetyltransferase